MDLTPKKINVLRDELNKLQSSAGDRLFEIQNLLNENAQFIIDLEDYWEGNWASNDYNHYYNPERRTQLVELNKEFFRIFIKKKKQIDVPILESEVFKLLEGYKSYKRHLLTELSVIDPEKFIEEREMLNKLEKYDWGFDTATVLKQMRPNNMFVQDVRIINKGIPNPPHIFIRAEWVSLTTRAYSVKDFSEKVTRLLRQLEIKSVTDAIPDSMPITEIILKNIFDNFHGFCNQLAYRHDKRQSIEVKDEYDVQDLLHSILKLHFNDIRAEEYSPSYAGSATRMDFLLKEEQIVIEVKKTRNKLDDKEVGTQLILDTAHYANHPNCKRLICFVYDPENRIKNPRGLEKDISKSLADGFGVEVYIRP